MAWTNVKDWKRVVNCWQSQLLYWLLLMFVVMCMVYKSENTECRNSNMTWFGRWELLIKDYSNMMSLPRASEYLFKCEQPAIAVVSNEQLQWMYIHSYSTKVCCTLMAWQGPPLLNEEVLSTFWMHHWQSYLHDTLSV